MRLTKRSLQRVIRESILLKESHDKAVNRILRMLRELPDPATEWVYIERDARSVCKKMGVEFGPAFTEALQYFGIDY